MCSTLINSETGMDQLAGEFSEIPIIDVAAIHGGDGAARQALTDEFAQVYGATGFAYISNHGIPQRLIDDVFAASARFHALPRQTKMAAPVRSRYMPRFLEQEEATMTSGRRETNKRKPAASSSRPSPMPW